MKGKVILLWTGGWDSTFRLLQLLHDTEAKIQPIYLVDEKRNSAPREIAVMRNIRRDLEEQNPETSDRLLPTDYGSYRATRIEPHHREAWETLKRHGRVGRQYPVLASYAEQNEIERLELSVMRHIQEGFSIVSLLDPLVESRDSTAGPVPMLPEDLCGPEAMFKRFSFPLFNYVKTEMREEAKRRSWMSIMEKTWFCFNPILGLPCGACPPCEIAQEEEMGHRVGWLGPMLAHISSLSKWFSPGILRSRFAASLERFGVKEEAKSLLRPTGLLEN